MSSQERKSEEQEAPVTEPKAGFATPAPRPKMSAPKRATGKAAIWFLSLLTLSLLGAGGIIYYRTFVLNQTVTAALLNSSYQTKWNQHQISDLQNELNQVQQHLQQQEEALRRQTQAIQDWQGLTQKGPSTRGRDHSAILDAQYFVKLAGDQLLLTQDVPQALSFLNQAQNELKEVNDPQAQPLKNALARDTAMLKNAPWVNLTNLYLSLSSLRRQIDHLPLLLVPVQNSEKPEAAAAPQSGWEKMLQHLWGALRQMVLVYHLPSAKTPPFITPDQGPYIYASLRSTLSDAGWAVLHHDSKIYHGNLQQAAEWVRQYFSLSSPLTKTVLNELQTLQAVSIQPPKEMVLVSPKVFDDYLKTQPAAAPTAVNG